MNSDTGERSAALEGDDDDSNHELRFAAARMRVLDEHMFRVDERGRRGTFRLQLFTADGVRPVAIATQLWGSDDYEGVSLPNASEVFAAAVWRQYFPGDAQPPIWIERSLSDNDPPMDEHTVSVSYTVTGPHKLKAPNWHPISLSEIEILIGGEFDPGRGDGYVRAEPEPGPELSWRIVPVVRLPRPQPFREPKCMPRGITWRRRLIQQLRPERGALACCWYHGGDWHTVNKAAIRLVRATDRAGVPADDVPEWCEPQLKNLGLTEWELQALRSLLSGPGIGIDPGAKGIFGNGQHRAQAMLDAGVRRTVVIHLKYPGED